MSSIFDFLRNNPNGQADAKTQARPIQRIRPPQAKEMLAQTPAPLLIDVRTAQEFRSGHIQGSKLLPLSDLAAKIGQVSPDKSQPLIVYCQSGARSAQAAHHLAAMGYQTIYDLGGIMSWPYGISRD